MRHIVKHGPPHEFVAWLAQASPDWQPTYNRLQSPEKPAVERSLWREQGGLCCYCGMPIDDSVRRHIDHLVPQSVNSDLALDYGNLLLSCGPATDDQHPQHREPVECHCGDARGNNLLPVTPLDADCAAYFHFELDGGIAASRKAPDAQRAERTIAVLRLDCAELSVRRQRAVSAFLAEHPTPEALEDGIADCDVYDQDGRLPPFAFVVRSAVTGD